jgi:imidazolonepropionase-like amidohydrolase
MFRHLALLVLLAAIAASGEAVARAAHDDATVTAIVDATIMHVDPNEPAAITLHGTVLIAGDRIKAVGPSSKVRVPAGATVIDGKGKWVVPGLIDSHVHFFQSGNLYTRPDAADFNRVMPFAQETARNKARLPETFKVWLASGVTSVADVGGPFWNFEVRDAARKSPAAPRVATTGPLVSMVDRPQLDLGDPPIIKIGSADEARALVRRELEHKPDFIKVWFIHRPADDLTAQAAIVKATAETAHAAGVRLAVHATELVVAKAALIAGADYLVHSVADEPVDQEFIDLARGRHILYCPTLFVGMGYGYALSGTWRATEAEKRLGDPQILAAMDDLARMPKDLIPERVARLMSEAKPPTRPIVAMQNLVRVRDAGIAIVMGTDAGNIGTLHGPSVFREMELMVAAGLSPLEVLTSATATGARTMGMERELGTIAPGRLADLLILDADPLLDIDNLSQVYRVMKGGRIFIPSELMKSLH